MPDFTMKNRDLGPVTGQKQPLFREPLEKPDDPPPARYSEHQPNSIMRDSVIENLRACREARKLMKVSRRTGIGIQWLRRMASDDPPNDPGVRRVERLYVYFGGTRPRPLPVVVKQRDRRRI